MPPKLVYLSTVTERLADEVPGGWENIAGFGVSLVMTYHTANPQENKYQHYYKSELWKLVAALHGADLVVGFNLERFDFTLLESMTSADLSEVQAKTFDMLPIIAERLSHRVSLENLARATLQYDRSDARLAVENWHRGELEKVKEFARTNVDLVRALFAHGCKQKHLLYWNPDVREKARLRTSNWQTLARSLVSL